MSNEVNPYESPTAVSDIPPSYPAKRCPNCSAEVTFWMALQQATPYYFTCTRCRSKCRVHTPNMSLMVAAVTLLSIATVIAIVAGTILLGMFVGVLGVPLAFAGWIGLEVWTHRHITRNGIFVPISIDEQKLERKVQR